MSSKHKNTWRIVLAVFLGINLLGFAWFRNVATDGIHSRREARVDRTSETLADSVDSNVSTKPAFLGRQRPCSVESNLSDDEYQEQLLARDATMIRARNERLEYRYSQSSVNGDAVQDARQKLGRFIVAMHEDGRMRGLVKSAVKQVRQIDAGQH